MLRQDKINLLIPVAMEAIEKVSIVREGIVPKAYEGYINSFGANINQSGLLPTLIFFNNDKNKEQESGLLLNAILYVMTKGEKGSDHQSDNLISYVIEKCRKKPEEKYNLSDLDIDKLDDFEEKIKDIVIALKLALRTFNIVEK